MDTAYKAANLAKPDKRQLAWQETEFYALISYGLPVFTSSQYGSGFTPAAVFWPEEIDTDSWCENVKAAGMKGLVLTCKNYDGFCLWPTALTDYSVKSSNWLEGEGDLVKMVAASCKKFGLKFGVSLSPWDVHEKTYGEGKAYDDFFCGLLTELCSDYGDLFCVRLDGMIGAEETKEQPFDWGRYYALIRSLQPDAAITFMGPDVRWYGLNGGITRNEVLQYSDPRAYSRRLIEIAEGDNIGITSYQEPDMAFLRSTAARELMRAPLFRYPYHMGEVLNCSVHVRSEGIEVDLYENLICRFDDHIADPPYRMSGTEEIYWGPNNARTVRLSVEPVNGNVSALEDDITKTLTHYQIVLSLYEEDGSWLRTLARVDYADYVQDGVIVFDRLGIAVVAPEVLRRAERFGRFSSWNYAHSGRDARGNVIHTLRLPGAQRLPRTLSALEQAAKGSFSEHRFSGRRGWY